MHRNWDCSETSAGNTIFSLIFPCRTLVCEHTLPYMNIERFVIYTAEWVPRFRLKGIVMYGIFPEKLKKNAVTERAFRFRE